MNKTIFITGTSTGFGKLTATTLAKEGFTAIAGMRGVTGKKGANCLQLAPFWLLVSSTGFKPVTF